MKDLSKQTQGIAKQALDKTVIVYSKGLCTGTLVDADLVLTAWHCVSKLRTTFVSWRYGADPVQAFVVAFDKQYDLAVLKLSKKSAKIPMKVSQERGALQDGESVVVIGHPRGRFYTVSEGNVIKPDENFFLMDARVNVGNSGGPVINKKGELVGVVIILNRFIGNRELGDAVSRKRVWGVIEAANLRNQVSLTEAESSIGFDIGGGQDALLDELSGPDYGTFYYGINYDLYDRFHMGFSHLTMRKERVWGYQLGYAFKTPLFNITPFFGGNYYDAGESVFAHKIGVKLELLFFDLTLAQVRHQGKDYLSYAVSF